MAWLGLNSKVKLASGCKGFLDITAKSNNINTAIEKACDELFYNYEGKRFLTLEINRVLIFLDRFDNPDSNIFKVMGRRYKSGSDIFLTRTMSLGKVNTEQWEDYQMFSTQMTALVKSWIELVKKDKEINADFLW